MIVAKYFEDPRSRQPPFPVRCGGSLSTALVSQMQLCHLHWLLSVKSLGDLHSQAPYVLHFLFHGNAAPIFEVFQYLEDVDQDKVVIFPCGSTWSTITGTVG